MKKNRNSDQVATSTVHQKNLHNEEQEFVNIASSNEFKKLITRKKTFLVPMTIFFMLFYFALPLLTSYTMILHQKAIGDITWVWVFAFAQFIMVWALATIYVFKANSFDTDADLIVEKTKRGDYR